MEDNQFFSITLLDILITLHDILFTLLDSLITLFDILITLLESTTKIKVLIDNVYNLCNITGVYRQ